MSYIIEYYFYVFQISFIQDQLYDYVCYIVCSESL